MKEQILVVDDEKNIAAVVEALLEREGYRVITLQDAYQVEDVLRRTEIATVITDLRMPGMSGMDVLERCRQISPRVPVVMMTAFATVDSAVSALKQGAFDFVTKPFDLNELKGVVIKAVRTFQRRRDYLSGEDRLLLGNSRPIKDVLEIISKAAATPSTVLILGETGTGKEIVAEEIHQNSDRKRGPFIKVNCSAIPHELIESELFGHEKGAFTGAVASKPGRFELAHHGTLFLDEIGEMPLNMQVKLLRVLQEQKFERVGGINSIRSDARIVAATNRNLAEEVAAGRFREDLFYRLNVIPVYLPPLRERREDIPDLAHYFLGKISKRMERDFQPLSNDVLRAFGTYRWPGNVRQLENAVERMAVMGEGNSLQLYDLPTEIRDSLPSALISAIETKSTFKEKVKQQTQSIERDLILNALRESDGNVTRSAEQLGLSRKGLQLKMKELQIQREDIKGKGPG